MLSYIPLLRAARFGQGRRRSVAPLVWLGALCLCMGASTARAQLLDLREHARKIEHLDVAVGLTAGVYVGDDDSTRSRSISPSPAVALRLWDAVVELSVPLSVMRQSDFVEGNTRRMRPGNVWLGASYLPDRSCGLTRLSLGIAAPTAHSRDSVDDATLALARGVHGSWDRYLWTADVLPLVLGYQTTLPLGEKQWARLEGEGDVSIGLPGGPRETQLGLQWAGQLTVGRTVRFGARIGATYWPTLPGDDFQSFLSTGLAYDSRHTRVSARFVMNLDGPLGFSFAPGGQWGLQAAFVQSF